MLRKDTRKLRACMDSRPPPTAFKAVWVEIEATLGTHECFPWRENCGRLHMFLCRYLGKYLGNARRLPGEVEIAGVVTCFCVGTHVIRHKNKTRACTVHSVSRLV